MKYCDYFIKHDFDLFHSLCWIYYPIFKAVRFGRTEQRIEIGDFDAHRGGYHPDNWTIRHRDIPTIAVYMRFRDENTIEFNINLPPMPYAKLYGRIVIIKAPDDYEKDQPYFRFNIADHCLVYRRGISHFPKKDYSTVTSDPQAAAIDKVFYEWLDEIRHLSTLAKVAL